MTALFHMDAPEQDETKFPISHTCEKHPSAHTRKVYLPFNSLRPQYLHKHRLLGEKDTELLGIDDRDMMMLKVLKGVCAGVCGAAQSVHVRQWCVSAVCPVGG